MTLSELFYRLFWHNSSVLEVTYYAHNNAGIYIMWKSLATGGRRAGDGRAAGGRQAQVRDRRATGARQAGDRRAPFWRRGECPSRSPLYWPRAAQHMYTPKKLALAGYVTGYVLLLIEQFAYKRGVRTKKNGDRN